MQLSHSYSGTGGWLHDGKWAAGGCYRNGGVALNCALRIREKLAMEDYVGVLPSRTADTLHCLQAMLKAWETVPADLPSSR